MAEVEPGRVYSDGESIFKEGATGDFIYVIRTGRVKITRQTDAGPVEIATLRDGEIFGEMAFFDNLPRSASAVSVGESRILEIGREYFYSSVKEEPVLIFKIVETMSRRIRRLNNELLEMKRERAGLTKLYFGVEEASKMILEEAKRIIDAENGSIMLLDDDEMLSIKAAFGLDETSKLRLRAGEGIAGDVLMTGNYEMVNTVKNDRRFKVGDININSLICVPLKFSGRCFGVINMSNCSGKIFAPDDLMHLQSLAVYASVAIQNARDFTRLMDAADRVLLHATLLDIY